jgi:hypothetical protein
MRGFGRLPAFPSFVNAQDDKMVELVGRMLDPSAGSELALRDSKGQALHRQLPKAKTPHEQESLQRQISATDKQILAPAFVRYGLAGHEIRTVEGGKQ